MRRGVVAAATTTPPLQLAAPDATEEEVERAVYLDGQTKRNQRSGRRNGGSTAALVRGPVGHNARGGLQPSVYGQLCRDQDERM